MIKYFRKFIFFLFLVFVIIFFTINFVLQDPARSFLGPNARETDVIQFRKEMGLDGNVIQRFFTQLLKTIQLDFGNSIYYGEKSGKVVLNYLGKTLIPVIGAQLLAVFFGFFIALFLWKHEKKKFSHLIVIILRGFQSIPGFLLLVIAAWLFRVLLGMTPIQFPIFFTFIAGLISSLFPLSVLTLWINQSLFNISLNHSFILFYAALGIKKRELRRMMVSMVIPVAVSIGIQTLSITFMTFFFAEFLFNLNGFGNLLFVSVSRNDFSVVMAGTLVSAIVMFILHMMGDVIKSVFDPREALS